MVSRYRGRNKTEGDENVIGFAHIETGTRTISSFVVGQQIGRQIGQSGVENRIFPFTVGRRTSEYERNRRGSCG